MPGAESFAQQSGRVGAAGITQGTVTDAGTVTPCSYTTEGAIDSATELEQPTQTRKKN